MKCMRCGTEIIGQAVFCEECLADMEKHPVKPGTPINLPRREKQQVAKRSRERIPKPEEQLSALRRLVIWQLVVIILLVLVLTASIYMLFNQPSPADSKWLPGQNYSTSASGE